MSVTRAAIAKAFKNAKDNLSRGGASPGTYYICQAIKDGNRTGDYNITKDGLAAKAVINNRLNGHDVVSEWLEENVPGARKALQEDRTGKLLQAYRHRWLDSLIAEFGG